MTIYMKKKYTHSTYLKSIFFIKTFCAEFLPLEKWISTHRKLPFGKNSVAIVGDTCNTHISGGFHVELTHEIRPHLCEYCGCRPQHRIRIFHLHTMLIISYFEMNCDAINTSKIHHVANVTIQNELLRSDTIRLKSFHLYDSSQKLSS